MKNKLFIISLLGALMLAVNTQAMTIVGSADHTYKKEQEKASNRIVYNIPRKITNIFSNPTPTQQQGATHNGSNEYKAKIERKDKYRPGYVFYEEKNCWINISVVPAITVENREMHLYYIGTNKEFVVHFRTSNEATAAHNILMKGLDCELPPYFVTEE